MAKEEKVLQGMIDKLIEIGSCYGMEMNVEKKQKEFYNRINLDNQCVWLVI